MSTEVESEFVSWAREELQRAGMFDEDSDYDGMIGRSAMDLVEAFSGKGHSGGSAAFTLQVFNRLVMRRPLSPVTNDPDEWMNVSGFSGDDKLWQSRRMPSAFSKNGGKTYWDVDEPEARWRKWVGRMLGRPVLKMHRSKAAT